MNKDSSIIIPVSVICNNNYSDSTLCKCELKYGVIQNEKEGHNFFSTDFFANLVSAGALLITLVIFIVQTRHARQEQRRTINENWYLTIILQPYMEELDLFYKEEAQQLDNQINILKKQQGNKTIGKAKAIKVLRDLKNDFFNHFILMVQGYDVNIAQEAEDILNELIDLISHRIDQYDNEKMVDNKRLIFENKAKLINVLYKGISKDNKKRKK